MQDAGRIFCHLEELEVIVWGRPMEAVDTEEGGRSGGQTIGLISSDGFEFIVRHSFSKCIRIAQLGYGGFQESRRAVR